nr:hypothetical protein [uncultured Tolumonas sp.]
MSKHSHHMTAALLGELKLCTEVGPSLGDARIHLLEAIDRLGSLTQAAKSIHSLTVQPGTPWMR